MTRATRTVGALLSVFAAGALLAGCGSVTAAGGPGDGATGGTTAPPSGGGTGPARLLTSLTVVAMGDTSTQPTTWTLTCNPPRGTHPQAAAACRQLASAPGDPFAPTPTGFACSMIYGGPEKAHVFGTFEGRRVDTSFGRTNGCEVARWQRVSALLVLKSGVGLPR